MVRLKLLNDPGVERVGAAWVNFKPPQATTAQLRVSIWARTALAKAYGRAGAANAQDAWGAAVEGSWWTAALNDLYRNELIGQHAYDAVVEDDPCGRVVYAMRWLRHLHIHQLRISGEGGPKVSPFGGKDVLSLGPSNLWLPADRLTSPADGVKSSRKRERVLYDEQIAGVSITWTLERALIWFDRLAAASGHDWITPDEDPTVMKP